jgi:transposase-like protein
MKRKQRRRWSPEEKQRLVAEARTRRRRGQGWREISEALGVRADSLHRWMRGLPGETAQQTTIQPVEVVGAVSAERADKRSGLNVVTADGFRVEGVDLETAVWLWRTLR